MENKKYIGKRVSGLSYDPGKDTQQAKFIWCWKPIQNQGSKHTLRHYTCCLKRKQLYVDTFRKAYSN